MSESHPDSQTDKEPSQQGDAKVENAPKASPFGLLNNDLRTALNNWEVLTEEMSQKASPEEEQLSDVKRLLKDLKAKLEEFGD